MNTTWTQHLKPKPAKSLAHALRRAAVQAVFLTACLGGSYAVSSALQPDRVVFPEQTPHAQVQAGPTQAERLLDRKCQPYAEGTIPGHAVVTLPGEAATYVNSSVGFDLWGPDQKFGTADDLPGTLHDFCL